MSGKHNTPRLGNMYADLQTAACFPSILSSSSLRHDVLFRSSVWYLDRLFALVLVGAIGTYPCSPET
jgi:hypothetical protein